MSEPLAEGELEEMERFVRKFRLPADATQREAALRAAVKGDMAALLVEVRRLRAVLGEAESRGRIAAMKATAHAVAAMRRETNRQLGGPGTPPGRYGELVAYTEVGRWLSGQIQAFEGALADEAADPTASPPP